MTSSHNAKEPKVSKLVNSISISISIISKLLHSIFSRHAAVLLFLNKKDLFERKVAKTPLKAHFPNYQGAEGKTDEAMNYVATLFRNEALMAVKEAAAAAEAHPSAVVNSASSNSNPAAISADPGGGRAFYLHYTCAVESVGIKTCFTTVADMLRMENVKSTGLC